MSRRYHLTVWRDQHCELFEIDSSMRIREAVIHCFREEFGCDPEFHWHKDGFMAEAWAKKDDVRSDMVQLDQTNRICAFLGPLPIIRRPCWALQRRTA